MTHFDGDNGNNKKKDDTRGPTEPDELEIPQGLGPILGSKHEEEENKKL